MDSEPRSRKHWSRAVEVKVEGRSIEHESERVAIEPLHSLRECVVDELLQHGDR